jgi:hypothetical protein
VLFHFSPKRHPWRGCRACFALVLCDFRIIQYRLAAIFDARIADALLAIMPAIMRPGPAPVDPSKTERFDKVQDFQAGLGVKAQPDPPTDYLTGQPIRPAKLDNINQIVLLFTHFSPSFSKTVLNSARHAARHTQDK